MKKLTPSDIIIYVLAFLPLITAILLYNNMPDIVPTHYGIDGLADNFGSKSNIFLMPLLNLILVLPFRFTRKNSKKLTNQIRLIITLCMTLLSFGILYTQYYNVQDISTSGFSFTDFIFLVMGIMFILLGNIMPKVRQNYFIGVRTWTTLHDEEIWEKTNRLTAKLFVLCGIILTVGAIFLPYNIKMPIMLITIAVLCIIPITYPLYLKHKKQQNQ